MINKPISKSINTMPFSQPPTSPTHSCFRSLSISHSLKTQLPPTYFSLYPSLRSSMATGNSHTSGYPNIVSLPQLPTSAIDGQTLSRLLQFERQAHQLTLEAFEDRGQKIRALEDEVQRQSNASTGWAWSYSQCAALLREKDLEIQQLRNKVQEVERQERNPSVILQYSINFTCSNGSDSIMVPQKTDKSRFSRDGLLA